MSHRVCAPECGTGTAYRTAGAGQAFGLTLGALYPRRKRRGFTANGVTPAAGPAYRFRATCSACGREEAVLHVTEVGPGRGPRAPLLHGGETGRVGATLSLSEGWR